MNNAPKSPRPSNLLSIQESQARKERPMTGFGLWRLGFRPFYLGAAAFSALAITLWLATLFGLLGSNAPLTAPSINPLYWHAHEMAFGFALAVIAGFLLTASNNWTGILPAAGLPLALLFALWATARLAMLGDSLLLAAACDTAFALLLSALLLRVLALAKLWKNFILLGMVALMGGLNGWFYTILLGDLPVNPLYPIELALLIILQLLVIMGGRVIPMFTQNGVAGVRVWRPQWLVWLTPLATALGIISWLTLPPRLASLLCVLAALVNLIRWIGWKPWQCLKQPMVWVLQLGYLWIPVTLFSLGLEALQVVPRSLPIHALAVGAMGLITAGMITRTAMGHTGRPILATASEHAMFVLIAISGVLRTLAAIPSLQTPTLTPILLLFSGSAWVIAFLVYLSRYSPWLFRPRLDGRPG